MLITRTPAVHAQTSSSSRPLSSTVIGTYVVRGGELTLLVLWRGSPGWYSRGGGGNGSSGGGGSSAGREFGSVSLTYGGRTFSIDFDYTARMAKLLDQDISLAATNVVLVDEVDSPSGAHIVSRQWVDPALPAVANSDLRTMGDDPAITAIRRAPALAEFLRCDVPLPVPTDLDSALLDPTVRARLTDYMQGMLTLICRQATTR